jgi:nitroimidazol reductase NimA-like FMN-containing flavoprotein (pyridoxamine 5'-phosphate oxidase superfamily)
MNSEQKTKYLIDNNYIMVLATADRSGKPWVSPVGFICDDKYNFFWVSYKDALHSNNIRTRTEVAISIFGKLPEGGLDGVYIDGNAIEMKDESEIQYAIDLFAKNRPQPSKFSAKSITDVTGYSPWRLYKATPNEISKRAESEVSGKAITGRELLEFWK